MFYISWRRVNISVEIFAEENINFINKQDHWFSESVNIERNLRTFFEDQFLDDFSDRTILIYLFLTYFIESTIFNTFCESKEIKHRVESLAITFTQIFAITGTSHVETMESKNHWDYSQSHRFTFSCFDLNKIIIYLTAFWISKNFIPTFFDVTKETLTSVFRYVTKTKNTEYWENLSWMRLEQIELEIWICRIKILLTLIMLSIH